jgi:acyl carrier protein
MNQDDILAQIVSILHDSFDIDPGLVVRDARLHDDLDIDSIDAIDLIVQLKNLVGRRLDPDEFKAVRTVGDVVDAVHRLVHEPSAERSE